MDYLLGGALGFLVSFVFAIPAMILETKKHSSSHDVPLIVDAHKIFGRTFAHREAFLVGLLLHLFIGFLFGLFYVVFLEQGLRFWFVYAFLSWLVVGLVIYPVLRMGFFAHKEGTHVWLETLVSHLLLGACLWGLLPYFLPSF